jgi:hypothetical protein
MPSQLIKSGSLDAYLARLQDNCRPGSAVMNEARADIRALVEADYRRGLMEGKDADDRDFAPLAASTLKDRNRGSGPPLVPHGPSSRIANALRLTWETVAGAMTLVGRLEGPEWMRYHLSGTSRLPRRDFAGIRPSTLKTVAARFARVADEIRKRGG